ncbi:hypothetical protein [Metabacillus schmidteae]|nr:hypothetical protein [Metabacillus schmidteae]
MVVMKDRGTSEIKGNVFHSGDERQRDGTIKENVLHICNEGQDA